MNTYKLYELLSFCGKAKTIENISDCKTMNDIEALNYYGGDKKS